MNALKIGLITDIHHGPNSNSKQGDKALELLEAFVKEMNQKQPDLVIDLGDRISNVDLQKDKVLEQEVAALFQELTVPYIHLLGNHDLEHLDREDNESALGQAVEHQSKTIKGFHLVFWQPHVKFPEGFIATEEQLEWLRNDLASTVLPSILFTHAPFIEGSMLGNYYFENAPKHYAGYKNAKAIREIIEARKVVACLSGHVHSNSLNCIRDIHHITLQSLTESFTTAGEAAESWAWLELSDRLHLNVGGKDAFELNLPLRIERQTSLEALSWSLTP